MSTLFDYDEREAPTMKAKPRQRVPVPAPDMEGTAGVLGVLDNEKRAYMTPRNRDAHYFRKHQGYAVSDKILNELQRQGVLRVLVRETDTGDVIEYEVAQFLNDGIPVAEEYGDPQTCVPEEQARVWSGHAEDLE